MPMYTNAVCDDGECVKIQPFWFDAESETFKDMLDFVVSEGWGVFGGPKQNDMIFMCPEHNSKRQDEAREKSDGT